MIASVVLAMALAACTSNPPRATATTFVLVRHAEKASDASKDPPLSPQGEARAHALATLLQDRPLAAVYATAYQRTQLTARPAAASQGLAVTTYDANRTAAEFAATLQRDHAGTNVLVVGHSNTVPDIAAALCRCSVAPIADGEFDRILTVRIGSDGTTTLAQDHY
ncbi:phosphoglycerate mutase family protein [Lysobacter fragariae]